MCCGLGVTCGRRGVEVPVQALGEWCVVQALGEWCVVQALGGVVACEYIFMIRHVFGALWICESNHVKLFDRMGGWASA